MKIRPAGALLVLVAVLGGCGLKGPLYLPEKSGDVVIRPAPAATTPQPAPGPQGSEPETSEPEASEPPAVNPPPGPDRD